jgi:leader peptidase (prepilin peptidase)/N-methyltransferase
MAELLSSSRWFLILMAPFIGSFLGVLILRLPEREPIMLSRSRCPHCRRTLGPRDLIPILSWLAAQRRCRYCGSALGWFYPNIEVAALLVAVWAAAVVSGPALWATCLLGWMLLALAVIDARRLILPDALTLPLIALGLAAAAWLDGPRLADHAIGAAAGFLAFWLVAALYRLLRRRDGLGLGDAKLLAAAGAWVSWEGLPGVVFAASLSALVFFLVAAFLGSDSDPARRLPFGPFLCLGIWLIWLYGPLVLA